MKKNKTITKFLKISFIFLILALVLGILAIVLPNDLVRKLMALSCCIMLVVFFIFLMIYVSRAKKHNKVVIQDQEEILKALNSLSKGDEEVSLLNVQSGEKELSLLASKVNELMITTSVLEEGVTYKGRNFQNELQKLVRNGKLTYFAYIRMTNVTRDVYREIRSKYPRNYFHLRKGFIDFVLLDFDNRKALEEYLHSLIKDNPRLRYLLAYYHEYSLDEIINLMDENIKNEVNEQVFRKEAMVDTFMGMIDKYQKADFSKNLLNDYLREMFPFLPFSNIGVLVDDNYYRVVTYMGQIQIHLSDEDEYGYFKTTPMFTYKGHHVDAVFASKDDLMLDKENRTRIHKFTDVLKLIMIHEMDKQEIIEADNRLDRLEELTNNLSYEIDEEYKVVHASNKLSERFNNNLVGKVCYEVIYGLEAPCKSCPLKISNGRTYLMGSKLYHRVALKNNEKANIYLLNEEKPYVNNRKDLESKLLSLLNNVDAKGYLICFKIPTLSSLAMKNKVSEEELLDEIMKLFITYGLNENLYRKDVDEFVYVLEEANVSEALYIAKQVFKVFLEKFMANNKEVSFTPKMVLLSFPLEVNTIFSLDSLCRTMFMSATRPGYLYRLDEKPFPVDNHRAFVEIVERSYIDRNIPLGYYPITDLQNKEHYGYVSTHYFDQNNVEIRPEELSLYLKIDNKFKTFIDKVTRAVIDLEEEDKKYIIFIGKEVLDVSLFSSLAGYFKSKNAPLDKVVFEINEKDIYNHLEEVNKIIELGFNLAINVNDSNVYGFDISSYRYIRIDDVKLEKDKLYQLKVNKLLNKGVDVMTSGKYNPDTLHVRYIVK